MGEFEQDDDSDYCLRTYIHVYVHSPMTDFAVRVAQIDLVRYGTRATAAGCKLTVRKAVVHSKSGTIRILSVLSYILLMDQN